jgi:2'-5' RNA ligase
MLLVTMGVKKYFIAIVIPEPLQQEIENIKQDLFNNYGLKGALRSPAHITLHRPFEWKEEKEEQMVEKLRDFKFDQKFDLQIKDFAYFEPRVIYADVLKNETLYQLHNDLSSFAKKELRLFNETEDMRGFHPHITVAFRDLKNPLFYELQSLFKEKTISGSFAYQGFSLLKLDKRWEELRFFSKD